MAPVSQTIPDLPRVRLEVRTSPGRSVHYEVGGREFLIGAAAGCDLRLPMAAWPPVIAQLSVHEEGVRIRRTAPGLEVLLNSVPLKLQSSQALRDGDRLRIGDVEIVVGIASPWGVSARLHPLPTPPRETEPPRLEKTGDVPESAWAQREALLAQREAELAERERRLEEQAEELRADRVAWYKRKEELQAEYDQQRAELREARARFEAECQGLLEERSRQDKDAADRFRASREELDRQRRVLIADRQALEKNRETFEAQQLAESERLRQWEATLTSKEAELAERELELRQSRNRYEAERQQFTEDLLRFERKQAVFADLERDIASRQAELQSRAEQLDRESRDLSERSRLIGEEEERLRQQAEQWSQRQAEVARREEELARRAGELESQQTALALWRAQVEKSREEARREAAELALARGREEAAIEELHRRIREAEQLRAELSQAQVSTELQRRRLEEQDSLLSAGLDELRRQRAALAAEEERLRQREADLDSRMQEFQEQAAALKGRLALALDLQARLEVDRKALLEREANLIQAEQARQALQEQVRRRGEELIARGKALDELARTLAAQKAAIDHAEAEIAEKKALCDAELAAKRREVESREAEMANQAKAYAEREASLTRQIARLQDVGRAVASERKALAEARAAWQAERAAILEAERAAQAEAEAFRAQIAAEIEALRAQIPSWDEQARAALERLNAAREMFRSYLAEWHDYSTQTRADLEAMRKALREESERLQAQEEQLDRARAEHRLAIVSFRQQLIEWKGKITEIRESLRQSESRLEAREAAINAAAKQVDANAMVLVQQQESIRQEREQIAWKRTAMERQLAEMREWYRAKLRELAQPEERGLAYPAATADDATVTRPRLAAISEASTDVDFEELDPGDLQLGELLLSAELIEAATLTELWAEAKRQRRTLRQILLSSGVITLYQLALIEAGNIEALVLDRFRVIDRIRTTPQEQVYRVFDPLRPDGPTSGIYMLRHLSEAESQDAVHPDEFRQRFAAARDLEHPGLERVVEVLDIQGRPAAVIEPIKGQPSSELSPVAGLPGVWRHLLTMAADALTAAHAAGLFHGRLTTESFILTSNGQLVLLGLGCPQWLEGVASPLLPSAEADLRALGQVAYFWLQLGLRRRGPKKFPDPLARVLKRLNAGDNYPITSDPSTHEDRPFSSARELYVTLESLANDFPLRLEDWNTLLGRSAEDTSEQTSSLKRSA